LALVLPISLVAAPNRFAAFGVAAVYFTYTLGHPLFYAVVVYYGLGTSTAALVYILVIATIAAFHCCFWSVNPSSRIWFVHMGMLAYGFLGLGLGSPLVAAGALFPYCGLAGIPFLIASLLLISRILLSPARPTVRLLRLLAALSILSLMPFLMHSLPPKMRHPPPALLPMNTAFGAAGFNGPSQDLANMDWIIRQSTAVDLPAVWLFPEGIISNWDHRDGWFVRPFSQLKDQNTTIIFGSKMGRDNVMVFRGNDTGAYRARVSVPFTMWGNGYDAHLWAQSVFHINGYRLGFLVCFEQLLPLASIETFMQRPDAVLAPSNFYWDREHLTDIDELQRKNLLAWSRLFGVPFARSINR
jgi:hypothetical protein